MTGWTLPALGSVLTPVSRARDVDPHTEYRTLGVKWYGEGLICREPIYGRDIKAKRLYEVASGDFVYNRLFAWKGSFALASSEHSHCYVSNEFPCFRVDETRVHPHFLKWFVSTGTFWNAVSDLSTGSSRQSRLRLKEERLLAMHIPLPSMTEQVQIVQKIESVASRVKETRCLRESIETERDQMVRALARELAKDAPRRPLQEVAPLVRRPVQIKKDAEYPELGIRSFGKGFFEKPTVNGADLTWQRPYWMKAGDLLFSNIKAWEGAVGVVPDALDGNIGSHRYISCVVDRTLGTPEFLCHWFLTDEGLRHLGASSPGATDRNRTLGLKKLMAIPVPVPPLDGQRQVSRLSAATAAARESQEAVARDLDALIPALLDEAFRGPPAT